jgi:hypothetical protein
MILYGNIPIYCFVNSSKFNLTELRKEIDQNRRLLSEKENRTGDDDTTGETEPEWDKLFYIPQLLADMDDMLAGAKESLLQKLCALKEMQRLHCIGSPLAMEIIFHSPNFFPEM